MNEESVTGQNQSMSSGEMTVEMAWNTGKALADWLPTLGSVIVVASNEDELTKAVIEGLRLQGRTVIRQIPGDIEMASAKIVADKLSGGISMSATGAVFLGSNGRRIEGEALADMQSLIAAGNFIPASMRGELIG